jgi:hypothetical protein
MKDRFESVERANFLAVTALMFCIRARLLVGPHSPTKIWALAPVPFSSRMPPDKHFVQDSPQQGLKAQFSFHPFFRIGN